MPGVETPGMSFIDHSMDARIRIRAVYYMSSSNSTVKLAWLVPP